MATPIRPVIEEKGDDAEEKLLEEKLLEENRVVIVPPAQDDGLVAVKSSKKVKLPEDEPAVGTGRFTIGPAPEPEPERDWEMVPPDGKWGWCVLVGATLVNILIPGTIKSFGVLLVEFNDVFHSSPAASSGIVALCYFLYSSLGPISSILSVKWSYRTVTLIGGSFAAFGMIFSSAAFSISYLYFSFGALVGAGAGLAFPPTVYIVTSYFVRLRGLANGICMSGSAFGSIVLPPVLRYLLSTYGYKGAVLILGGIMLNVWAAALLFQPVEEHMVRKYKEEEEEEETPQDDILFEEEEPVETLDTEISPTVEKTENGHLDKTKNPSQAQIQNITPVPSQNQLRNNLSKRKLSYSRPIPKTTYSSTSIGSEVRKLGSTDAFRRLSTAGPKRNYSTSSFAYVPSTPFHGSTLSAFEQPNEFASQFSLKSITDSVAEVAYCCFCCKKKPSKDKKERSKFFDLTLLSDPAYLIILLSGSTVAISVTNFIILLPSHAENIGFDKERGAYLLSTVSALDLVGRIGGSALCDLNLIPKTVYFVGGLVFSGIALIIVPFLKSYLSISIVCAFFGLASGVNNSVTALVMAEVLGIERLMSTYGISLFVNGILQLIGPPICGLWFERDRNFVSMFITFGFIFIAGASLWLFMPIVNRRKKLQAQRAQKLEPFAEETGDIEDSGPPKLMFTPEDTPGEKYLNGSPPIFKNKSNALLEDRMSPTKDFARSASAALVANERTRKISTPASSRNALNNISSKNHLPSNPSLLESVPEGKSSNSQDVHPKKLQVPKTPKRSPSTSSFQYMSTPFHGSTLSAFEKPSEFTSQFSLKSVTDSLAPITYCCGCKKQKDENVKKEPSKYFDVQLLKDPIYLVILISNCTSAISYTNFIILVPSYADESGFDKTLGAYLLSIISALDLVGRIGGSALSDVVSTPKRYFFICGLLLSGISLSMMPLVSTYSAISVFCSIFGLASGIMTGVTALVMTEMLGTERLMSSYGISLFVNGILQLVGPPICGFWFEYTHSYKSLFVTLGFVLIAGAALWGFVPFILRRRKMAQLHKECAKA